MFTLSIVVWMTANPAGGTPHRHVHSNADGSLHEHGGQDQHAAYLPACREWEGDLPASGGEQMTRILVAISASTMIFFSLAVQAGRQSVTPLFHQPR